SLAGEDILRLMEGVYNTFHERFKFTKMDFPPLDFEGPRNRLNGLVTKTENFCKDPVNIVMTEKRFMIRKFWRMLIDEARKIFNDARSDTERWLAAVPLPLETQIKDHKAQLQARLDALAKVNERGGAIKEEVAKLEAQRAEIQKRLAMITSLILKVREAAPSAMPAAAAHPEAAAAAPAAAPVAEPNPEFLKTTRTVATAAPPKEFLTTQKLDLSSLRGS
ncbi:MAG TPA: hypothetical protein VFV17_01420, partial [Usitatibacteraceae bacterium]|nr:hypothetical protein [Usitatibacteraceae bacterium]